MAHYRIDDSKLDGHGNDAQDLDARDVDVNQAENGAVDGQTAAAFLARNAQPHQPSNNSFAQSTAQAIDDERGDGNSLRLDSHMDSLPAELMATELLPDHSTFNGSMPIDSMRVEVQARQWTTRVIALLLAGQAFILLAIIWVTVSRLNWAQQFRYVMLSMTVMDTLLLGGLLLPMAIFNFFTAMGLWLGQRSAWLRAMTSQGVLLIFCLSSYVANRGERFIFMLMLTCIVLVLYLNTYDVRLAFNSRESKN